MTQPTKMTTKAKTKPSKLSGLQQKIINVPVDKLRTYMVFELGTNTVDFCELLDTLSYQEDPKQRAMEFRALNRIRASAAMLLPYYQNRRATAEYQLEVLYSRLYKDTEAKLKHTDARITDKAIRSEILVIPEYSKLMDKKLAYDLRVNLLFSVIHQVDRRREDMRLLYGGSNPVIEG